MANHCTPVGTGLGRVGRTIIAQVGRLTSIVRHTGKLVVKVAAFLGAILTRKPSWKLHLIRAACGLERAR